MARTTYHHGALRQALIDGAREILTEQGHEHFSLNEVARRAGVSTAAPYRHFAGKEELLTAVAEQGYETLRQDLARAAAATPEVGARLLSLGGAYVRFAREHPDLFATMFRSRPGTGPVGLESFDILLNTVAEAQHSGVIRRGPTPELMARSIWSTLHGIAVLSLRRPHDLFGFNAPPEELAAESLSALLGLEGPPQAATATR
ncbi:TetR/AcrR family transcriptional regulator [Nocardia sp. NPDC060256]|uniref:TetR/AcrR family transcriptional regulator n=1 Tax=unclassified Nocardia TaxID=2637762 RepID=UPI0036461137